MRSSRRHTASSRAFWPTDSDHSRKSASGHGRRVWRVRVPPSPLKLVTSYSPQPCLPTIGWRSLSEHGCSEANTISFEPRRAGTPPLMVRQRPHSSRPTNSTQSMRLYRQTIVATSSANRSEVVIPGTATLVCTIYDESSSHQVADAA